MATKTAPKVRRVYHQVYAPVAGLKWDTPSTMIQETETPDCEEVKLVENTIQKATGVSYFADTETNPLDGTVMMIDQYYTNDGSERLIIYTTEDAYWYNPLKGQCYKIGYPVVRPTPLSATLTLVTPTVVAT